MTVAIWGLLRQASLAVPEGGSSRDVTTFITRGFWEILKRETGDTLVYGTHTVVVDEDGLWAVSVASSRLPALGQIKGPGAIQSSPKSLS